MPVLSSNTSYGKTWGNDEIKALLQIWADDHIAEILVETHKNSEVFKLFSDILKEIRVIISLAASPTSPRPQIHLVGKLGLEGLVLGTTT